MALIFLFKQKTAYEMRISDWSSDVCSSDLRPHRSLSPRGFLLLMALICAISFTGGLFFYLMGAWPVIGFMGADVLLIYLAFRINYRSGHLVERLHLTRDSLTVRRIWPGGPSRTREFQPYWQQVVFDEQAVGNASADRPRTLRPHCHHPPDGK